MCFLNRAKGFSYAPAFRMGYWPRPTGALALTDTLLSIVIVSFNAKEHLRRCLSTLYEHQHGRFEVIVVDNASPDDSASIVAKEVPQARLIANPVNAGFAVAANLGAGESTGDVIVFLNPDSELRQDAARRAE